MIKTIEHVLSIFSEVNQSIRLWTKLCVDLSVSTLDFDNYPSTPKPSSSRQELFVLAAKLILCWPFHDLMSLDYYALKLSHKILKIVLTV